VCESLPLAIRGVSPGPGFTRLSSLNYKGLPDGVHTGGAWLSPDGQEVWKPLDCRPWLNAEHHVPTRELECLELMAGQPAFPRNWRVEEAGEIEADGKAHCRRWLVREKAWIPTVAESIHDPARMTHEQVLAVEQGVRALNERGWEVGDSLMVGVDRRARPFIVDLSNAYPSRRLPGDGEEKRILEWFEWMGWRCLARLRRNAKHVYKHGACSLLDPDLTWPRTTAENGDLVPDRAFCHVYAALHQRLDFLEDIGAHYVRDADRVETGVSKWVITRERLSSEQEAKYHLTWAWSPIPLQEEITIDQEDVREA